MKFWQISLNTLAQKIVNFQTKTMKRGPQNIGDTGPCCKCDRLEREDVRKRRSEGRADRDDVA